MKRNFKSMFKRHKP